MPLFEKPIEETQSLVGILFSAVLFTFIGAFLGFMLLASIDPEPFESVIEYENKAAERTKPTLLDAHYFRGLHASADDWVQKRDTLLAASSASVELTDAEMNTWVTSKFTKPLRPSVENSQLNFLIVPGLPNFFINAVDRIYFSLPLELSIFNLRGNFILICEGRFSEAVPTQFEVTSLRLNEAVIPLPIKAKNWLLNAALVQFHASNEFIVLKDAWNHVEAVELINDQVRLNLTYETETL